MTTAKLSHHRANRGHSRYGLGTVAQMEWHKLRSVRSTWYVVVVFAAGMIGLAVIVLGNASHTQMSAADRASFDPTSNSFAGLLIGQLLLGILGVLAITTEFSSGMIRATFAAVPRRPLVLAAKAAVLGTATLALSEVLAFAAFFAGQAALKQPVPHAALGQPGVLRAVLMAGAYPALIALIGLGLGAIIRHTAGTICAVVVVLFLLPLLMAPLGVSIRTAAVRFLPEQMAVMSLTAVKPVAHSLPPALAFGLLCGYAAAALVGGAWALARRDA
jgi:ABC-2 type transport system permease protein